MQKGLYIVAAASVIGALSFGSAQASSYINEVESNDTLATAQNLDGTFSLFYDPWVTNSDTDQHVSVLGTGDGTYDWYSFTVTAPSTWIFDIDQGNNDPNLVNATDSFDPFIRLFDSSGSQIAQADDYAADPGSESIFSGMSWSYDSYLTFSFTSAGTYFLKVAQYGIGLDDPVGANSDYILQIAASSGAVGNVPVPAAAFLFTPALLGGAAVARRRKKAQA